MRRLKSTPSAQAIARRAIVLVCLLFGAFIDASLARCDSSQTKSQSPPAIIRDSAIVVGNGTVGPYFVSGYFIIVGSESVQRPDGAESLDRVSAEYSLDPNTGWLKFARPLPRGDSAIIRFTRLAFVCPPELRASQSSPSEAATGQIIPVSQVIVDGFEPPSKAFVSPLARPNMTSLHWHGYKSFSVNTSSGRSADWSQGLDLAVSGEIARGLKLTAALSDRLANSAGQSGPDATRLGDLDRIYIEARSAKFSGRWGDLAVRDSRTGAFSRHATGLNLGVNTGAHQAAAYVGYASGEIVRRTLLVQGSDAGPYRLTDKTGVAVVPGSIVLTLDGKRLREGPSSDFTLDPRQNTITFNPSVTLGAHPQVVVEFEQTLDSYRRFIAGGGWSLADSTRPLKLALTAHFESDDPNRPLFGSLTDTQWQLLSQTRDQQVTISSANFAGAHHGDYRLDLASPGDSVFIYVGPDNGDWRVNFRWMGQGHGRYRHLAESAYEYVGDGKGAYEPISILGAPEALANLAQTFNVATRRFGTLDGLWSASLHDANRLATHSTDFLSGHRIRWSLGAEGKRSPNGADTVPARRMLSIEWRRVADGNRRVTGVDDLARFLDAWGLRSVLFDSSRNEYQTTFAVGKQGQTELTTEAGLLNAHDLRAWRVGATSSTRIWNSLTASLQFRHHSASGTGANAIGNGQSSLYETRLTFSPTLARIETGWRQNQLDNHAGIFEPAPELATARWISLGRGPVVTEYRWETVHDSNAVLRRTREWSLSTSTDYHDVSHGQLTVTRGQQAVGNGAFSPYYRGLLTQHWQPASALTLDAELRLTHGHAGAQREIYLPTVVGQGQYRLERGEYVPDLHGDYRRVLAQADDMDRDEYDGHQRIATVWRPKALGWNWTLESQMERNAQYDPARFRPGVWLQPWNAHSSALLAGSRAEERYRFGVIAQPDPSTELSARWVSDESHVRGEDQNDNHDQLLLSIRHNLGNSWILQSSLKQDNRTRDLASPSAIAARATTISATVGASPAAGVRWTVEGRRRWEYESAGDNSVGLWGVRPVINSNIGPLVVSSETDATWVSASGPGHFLSALLAEGRPAGFSLMQFCEVRLQLPGRITVRSNLNADLRQSGPNRWRWELETTAAF